MKTSGDSRLMEIVGCDFSRFTEVELKIVNFLIENEEDIQKLSIGDIADGVGVSRSAVVRLCKTLSFDGLKDFRVWYEAGKRTTYSPVLHLDGTEDADAVSLSLTRGLVGAVTKTLDSTNISTMTTVSECIRGSEHIAVMSGEKERAAAESLVWAIRRRFPDKSVTFNDDGDTSSPFSLVFCLPGNERRLVTHLTDVILNGGEVAAFTAARGSLIGKAASYTVVLSDDELISLDSHLLGVFSLLSAVDFLSIILSRP